MESQSPNNLQNNTSEQVSEVPFQEQLSAARAFFDNKNDDTRRHFSDKTLDVGAFVAKLESINEKVLAQYIADAFDVPLVITNYQAHNKAFDTITFRGDEK